jgi:glycosyltransferase involved in cell wall biosynthesis
VKTVVAFPGNMAHAQHAARAMAEVDCLTAYVTTLAFRPDGRLASLLKRSRSEAAERIRRQLARRSIDQVPANLVHSHPIWEILRSAAQKAGAGPVVVDALWDRLSYNFDALVARRYVSNAQCIQSFEYTALASFERAKDEGVAAVLHLPSLDGAQFREIERRERNEWKELAGADDGYFDRKFPRRQERRLREIALADMLIANSFLTARSHIAAGVDPAKIFIVGLGGPPAIAEIRIDPNGRRKALRVIVAGPFSLRKGGHYLLKAWQILNAGSSAVLDVYGRLDLPERVLAGGTDWIVFHGSVSQSTLFNAFETADVLVFPTLSDGFGMVVAEAMAHGLPVITTDQAGAADWVTPENGIVVPAANAHALADALRWCLDNRDRLQEMRAPALQTAQRRQWSDFRKNLIDVLEVGLRAKGYSVQFQRSV